MKKLCGRLLKTFFSPFEGWENNKVTSATIFQSKRPLDCYQGPTCKLSNLEPNGLSPTRINKDSLKSKSKKLLIILFWHFTTVTHSLNVPLSSISPPYIYSTGVPPFHKPNVVIPSPLTKWYLPTLLFSSLLSSSIFFLRFSFWVEWNLFPSQILPTYMHKLTEWLFLSHLLYLGLPQSMASERRPSLVRYSFALCPFLLQSTLSHTSLGWLHTFHPTENNTLHWWLFYPSLPTDNSVSRCPSSITYLQQLSRF